VLIATVSNGMNVLNISSYWQPMVIGVIILGAVSADTYRRAMEVRGLRGLSLGGLRVGRGLAAIFAPRPPAEVAHPPSRASGSSGPGPHGGER